MLQPIGLTFVLKHYVIKPRTFNDYNCIKVILTVDIALFEKTKFLLYVLSV